jgi:hypothetical protein
MTPTTPPPLGLVIEAFVTVPRLYESVAVTELVTKVKPRRFTQLAVPPAELIVSEVALVKLVGFIIVTMPAADPTQLTAFVVVNAELTTTIIGPAVMLKLVSVPLDPLRVTAAPAAFVPLIVSVP